MTVLPKARILVVDDEASIRELCSRILSRAYTVAVAGDGPTALAMARAQVPDLVLTDIRMPGISGLEAARQIISEAPDVSVVVMTGFNDFDNLRETVKLGVNGFLMKPFTPDDLLKTVGEGLRKGLHFKRNTRLRALRLKCNPLRRPSPTVLRRSSGVKGFIRKPFTPSFTVSRRLSKSLNPVITTTETSGVSAIIWRAASSPLMPGIRMSVRTRSGTWARAIARAVGPSPATATVYVRPRIRLHSSRMDASSSTTRIRALGNTIISSPSGANDAQLWASAASQKAEQVSCHAPQRRSPQARRSKGRLVDGGGRWA